MEIIDAFEGKMVLDQKTYAPYVDAKMKINIKSIKDAQMQGILTNDEIAKQLGKRLLKALSNVKTDLTMSSESEPEVALAPTPKPEPIQVAKVSMVTKIARQVEGEYVFVDVVKAHKDSKKLREYMDKTEFPRTEVIGKVPCVIEYGVLEDIEVDVD